MEPLSAAAGRAALRRLAAAPRPILFLDVDGTLAPLAPRPHAARVPHSTRRILEALRDTSVAIVLVSGRAARDARRIAGSEFDGILGNHGAELLKGRKSKRWVPSSMPGLRASERALTRMLRRRFPGIRLEHKGHSIALHHRLSGKGVQRLMPIVRRELHADIAALPGRQVIDVRGREADKGAAVLRWLRHVEGDRIPASHVLYAGDDTTDEDAFRALDRRSVTIGVGPRPEHSRFRTATPQSLAKWLRALARMRKKTGRIIRPVV
jgi:trehalose 6-phosphate phosphatase